MAGIARESYSRWNAPIVLVGEPDGSWRYRVDFRKLGEVTEKMSFSLPNSQDSLRRFKDPKVFSSLVLWKGYFQIPIVGRHRR